LTWDHRFRMMRWECVGKTRDHGPQTQLAQAYGDWWQGRDRYVGDWRELRPRKSRFHDSPPKPPHLWRPYAGVSAVSSTRQPGVCRRALRNGRGMGEPDAGGPVEPHGPPRCPKHRGGSPVARHSRRHRAVPLSASLGAVLPAGCGASTQVPAPPAQAPSPSAPGPCPPPVAACL